MPKQTKPHMLLNALDPPRKHPPRRWECAYCGLVGFLEDVQRVDCTATSNISTERALLDALKNKGSGPK